jgi:hypothetical protein
MRRVLAVGIVVGLLTAGGCSSPDGTVRDIIANMNRLSDAIDKGESKERQEELAQKVKDSVTRFDLLKLTEEQKKAIFDKHSDELAKAVLRLKAAADGPNSKIDPAPLYR